jgi:hypothetical protein
VCPFWDSKVSLSFRTCALIFIYNKERKAKTGSQDRHNRRGRTGQAEKDKQNRTCGTEQTELERQNGTGRSGRLYVTEQAEQDS